MPEFSLRLVRELKGAPLSVWMALMFAGSLPVNQAWLERSTGYSDKPIRQALYYLFEHGFVIRVEGGWIISDKTQNPFQRPSLETQRPELPAEDIELDTEYPVSSPDSDTDGHIRNNSDSPSEDPQLENDPPADPPDSDTDSQIRNNSDSQASLSDSPPNSEANGQIGKKSLPPISIINNAFKDSLILNNTNSAGGKNSLPTRENFPNTSLLSDLPGPGAALQTFGIRQDRHPPDRLQTQHCAVQDPQIIAPRPAPPRRQRPAGYQLRAPPSAFPTHFAYQQMVSTIAKKPATPNLFTSYADNIGLISAMMAEQLQDTAAEYPHILTSLR